MDERGYSASELARKAGVKTTFLYDVLRGKSHNPSILRLSKVADALELPVSQLLTTESQPIIPPLPYQTEWLIEQQITPSSALQTYIVEEDHMAPTICAGDTVLVDSRKQKATADAIYCFDVSGRIIAGRIKGSNRGGIFFDNPEIQHPEADDELELLGRVVLFSRRV